MPTAEVAVGFHGDDGSSSSSFLILMTLFLRSSNFSSAMDPLRIGLLPDPCPGSRMCEMCREKESSNRNCSLEFNIQEICYMISRALRSLSIHSRTRMRVEWYECLSRLELMLIRKWSLGWTSGSSRICSRMARWSASSIWRGKICRGCCKGAPPPRCMSRPT